MRGRAAIYCRVSSSIQEDGASLDEQERICREYADREGYQCVAVFRETADGEEIERPQLRQLLAAARRGDISVVVIWKQDRLGRGNKAHEVVFYMCELVGLTPLCVLEPYGDSSEALMTRGMRGIVSGEEKKNIRLRTQGGRRARARAGKLIPGPRPLYGYRWLDAGNSKGQTKIAYQVDPETAPVVRRIFEELAAGRSLRAVADGLHDDGIPTPNGGRRWVYSTVQCIARHPGYAGEAWAFGAIKRERARRDDGSRGYRRVRRPDDERVGLPEGVIPPIVPRSLVDIVRERLAQNRIDAARRNNDPEAFLLRGGFVRCGECGNVVHCYWRPVGRRRIKTPYYVVRRTPAAHADCPGTAMVAQKLDEAVWSRVERLLLDPAIIEREVERLRTEDPTGAALAAVDKALTVVARRQEQAARAITLLDDEEAAAPLVEQLSQLARQKRELEEERRAAQLRQDLWRKGQRALDQVEAWRERAASNLCTLSYELKRDVLTALDVRVVLFPESHGHRFDIEASIPFSALDERDNVIANSTTCCTSGAS